MVPIFQSWDKLFCPEGAECNIDAAIYYVIYKNYDTSENERTLEAYMRQIHAEWIRPNLISVDGKTQNIQRYLEKQGRFDPAAKIAAKIYQTFDNQTRVPKALYEKISGWFYTTMAERAERESIRYLPHFPEMLGMFESDFTFAVGKELYLYITDDPHELIFKTQGRPWEGNSCERFTGEYPKGFITDIGWGNLIAFIVDKHGMPVARKMIRWAKGKNKDDESIICLNLEPVWYYDQLPIPFLDEYEFLETTNRQIEQMIIENEYYCPESETPYYYLGYSDAKGGSGTINYSFSDEDAEDEYLIFRSDAADSVIHYVQNMNPLERGHYLANDFEYASEDEALSLYLFELAEDVESIFRWPDFEAYLDLLLEDTGYHKDILEWDITNEKWIIDKENPWYLPAAEEERNRDLIFTQALLINSWFINKGEFEDSDWSKRDWLIALFTQYWKRINYRNTDAGPRCERLGGDLSFVGNMTGGGLYYFTDTLTLFTENDAKMKEEVVERLHEL